MVNKVEPTVRMKNDFLEGEVSTVTRKSEVNKVEPTVRMKNDFFEG
jgi:hypothetical protein